MEEEKEEKVVEVDATLVLKTITSGRWYILHVIWSDVQELVLVLQSLLMGLLEQCQSALCSVEDLVAMIPVTCDLSLTPFHSHFLSSLATSSRQDSQQLLACMKRKIDGLLQREWPATDSYFITRWLTVDCNFITMVAWLYLMTWSISMCSLQQWIECTNGWLPWAAFICWSGH